MHSRPATRFLSQELNIYLNIKWVSYDEIEDIDYPAVYLFILSRRF